MCIRDRDYTDSDKDGIIYIKSMEPGKCTISMKSAGGYAAPKDITAQVKANIEYSVVDVSDEIKSESEINVAAEDSNTNGNADAGTAQVLKDTVEYVESSKDVYKRQEKRNSCTGICAGAFHCHERLRKGNSAGRNRDSGNS